MSRWLLMTAMLCGALPSLGCNLSRPNWMHPGPGVYQQQRAVLFDPYADTEMGPEVVGSRPRDYQKQRSEPTRSQLFPSTFPVRSQLFRGTVWGNYAPRPVAP